MTDVDGREGHTVLGSVRVVADGGVFKPVAPEYLLGQVGGSHLDSAAGVRGRPLQGNDNLELTSRHIPGRHAVERGGAVNLVSHHHWPEGREGGATAVNVASKLHAGHVVGDGLPLLRGEGGHHLTGDHTPDEPGGPEVCQPHYQVQAAVPHSDQGVPAEHDGLRSAGGFGELGEHYPSHTGLVKYNK